MELSPEEYGTYWAGSIRIAAGILVILGGYRLASPLLGVPELGARVLGIFLLIGIVLAGTYIAVLGVARVVRTAIDVEMG